VPEAGLEPAAFRL